MNKFEEIKAAKDGLDVLPEIERYSREGWEAITDDDKVRLKWYGVFFRKHTPGAFMMRIRIPGGVATTAQLRTMGRIADDFCRGDLDLTTREQAQIRWFRVEHVPEIFARLAKVDLNSLQTGMDNIRNVMSCPLAGLTTHELFDASPVVQEYTERFVGNKAFSNLPRKFNVAITGCLANCLHLETQDISLAPAVRHVDGARVAGFNVHVGGKQGSGGFTAARALDAFVRPEVAAEVCAQITLLFRDHGPRESRSRARMAFLVDQWGVERFRAELGDQMGQELEHAGLDVRGRHNSDHLGVEPQHEQGRYSVGLAVPVGRLTSAQIFATADLADQYGRGSVRLTPGQNLILTDVTDDQLRPLLAEPLLQDLRPDPTASIRGTVACTGIGLCDLALTDTKVHALRTARRLEQSVPSGRAITINWSGCPAACASHHTADIGLQGGKARVGDRVVEVYQVFVGGRSGPGARAAMPVLSAVPTEEIGDVVERLARGHGSGHLVETARQIAAERNGADPADAEQRVA